MPAMRKGFGFTIFATVLVAAGLIMREMMGPTLILGGSMEPTFHDGTIVSTDRHFDVSDITYGTVVNAAVPEEGMTVIKRVVALPMDTIEIRDGFVYVNGRKRDDGFERVANPGIAKEPVTLSDDEFFLLGDNRNGSLDSRDFGPVKDSDIKSIVTDLAEIRLPF